MIVALLVLCVAGCGRPPAEAPLRIAHGSREIPKVALTFDGCSSKTRNVCDQTLLDAIRTSGIRATFFLGGIWMEKNAAVVRELAANPAYEIGLHGWGHLHVVKLDDARLETEFDRSVAAYQTLTGRAPRLYRPPFGVVEPRDLTQAKRRGLTIVEFDVPAGDSDPGASVQRLTRWVVRKAGPGSIVIFHVNGRGTHTAEALPGIVAGLRAKGLAFATVGELIEGERAISR